MTGFILAGDAGGTKTLLALIPSVGRGRVGGPAALETYRSADFPSLEAMIGAFRSRHPDPLVAVSIGFAGAVAGGRGVGTHVPWVADERELERLPGVPRAHVINDLVAAGYAIPALSAADLVTIIPGPGPGRPAPDGNAAIVSAGTGLGETILVRHQGDLVPVPSEGGHADFAPRTDPELEVFRALRAEHGRVSVERVLSGPGLVNVARVFHARDGAGDVMAGHMREAGPDALPAAISGHALAGTCASCARSLDLLVGVYGAEAGNAALRGLARSGVYLGGGIPPRILPALKSDTFRDAFLAKEPLRGLLEQVPVHVLMNERASVIGAARFATL
ncbi:MAG TPA: glucokinase [Candidatus Limnocylindrales bacterium]|nr:glucokinase [Candidatus Limnocylindrales bacterium]